MTIKFYHRKILDHYKRVAQSNGLSAKATMDDPFVREKEVAFVFSEIDRFKKESGEVPTIMDVGCGNGYLLSQIRKNYLDSPLLGIEFTPELLELAKSRKLEDTELIQADCAADKLNFGPADIIITERVIINILNRKDQYKAVGNIIKMLKPGGVYIMIESFKEPLFELNQARAEMCLEEVEMSYQNLYINESFVRHLGKEGLTEIPGTLQKNYLSTHFYVTRVFHKSVRPDGGRVKFSRMAKFFTAALPQAVGNYSPILFRVFRRNSE